MGTVHDKRVFLFSWQLLFHFSLFVSYARTILFLATTLGNLPSTEFSSRLPDFNPTTH